MKKTLILLCFSTFLSHPFISESRAESQGNDYKGITDPFGDPANYEFAEDELDDKEFFHLGRFLMLGFDIGVGAFTGGLGKTAAPGFDFGGRMLYFFDKLLGLELAIHFSAHSDLITPNSSSILEYDTKLIPITAGLRYYFNIQNAPRAIALANPYLVFAAGLYIRSQTLIQKQNINSADAAGGSTSSFGVNFGTGVEFPIYGKSVYLGADLRYHLVFFPDEGADLGFPDIISRGGDFFTGLATISFNF